MHRTPAVPSPLISEHTDAPLTEDEAGYVAASRAPNTLRGYRTDLKLWAEWCDDHGYTPLPADPVAVARYLAWLASQGTAVGTMSRRLSALRFAHQLQGLPSPAAAPRVMAVWEGIRRTHGRPPEQSEPLMPPELFAVIDACPTEKLWRTPGREPEPSLAGARDRVLLLVGFVGALRRSELAGWDLEHTDDHPNGLVIALPRSKTNQTGETELVVVPRTVDPARCPVQALERWLELTGAESGPVLRKTTRANRAAEGRMHPESLNRLVQTAVARAGIDSGPYSAHSLRAGFVTYSHLRGASDRAIAHQTRHRSMSSLGAYIRVHEAWQDNAATQLGW